MTTAHHFRARRFIVPFVLGLVTVLVAAACGGEEPAATATKAPAVQQPAPTAAPTTAVVAPTRAAPTATVAPTATTAPAKAAPTATAVPKAQALAPKLKVALSEFGHNTLRVWLDGHFIAIPAFDPVIEKDSTAELNTKLSAANKWEASADFKTWKFWVNPACTFQDGRACTNEDLKASVDVWRRLDTTGSMTAYYRDHLKRSEVVGDHYEMEFDEPRLSTALVDLTLHQPTLLLNSKRIKDAGVQDIKTADAESLAKAFELPTGPVASGPFKVTKFIPSDVAEYEANRNYWKPGPFFESLELDMVTEDATRIALLRTGAADIINITTPLLDTVEKANLKYIANPGGIWVWATFKNLYDESAPGYNPALPWMDKRVREALNIGIDRQQLLKTFYKGLAQPTNCPMLGTGTVGFQECKYKDTPVPFDPARGKQLIKDAGHAGATITLRYPVPPSARGPEIPQLTEAVAAMWETNLGLKTKIEPFGTTEMDERYERRQAAPWLQFDTNSQNPFGGEVRLLYFAPQPIDANGRMRYTNYLIGGDQWKQLWKNVVQEPDLGKRAAATARFSEYLRDDWALFPLFMNGSFWGVSSRIEQWKQAPGVSWGQRWNMIVPKGFSVDVP